MGRKYAGGRDTTHLWIVNVLFWTIATESVCRDLEFARGKAEGHEGKAPEQDSNGIGRELLESTDIDGLRVISEPIAKVDWKN